MKWLSAAMAAALAIAGALPADAFNIVVTASPTPAPASGHTLDDTGCTDMAAGSMFNNSEASAAVDSASASQISNATTSTGNSSLGLQVSKRYAVVPSGSTLYNVGANGRSTHPSSFPIPSYAATIVNNNGDHTLSLVEIGSGGSCSFWEGYDFSGSGTTWTAYSGNGPIPGTGNFLQYPQIDGASGGQPCDGVSDNCPMDLGANLTYYEMNHGATQAILHTIHGEAPYTANGGTSGMTCDDSTNTTLCIHPTGKSASGFGMIRLKKIPETGATTCPSDANASAVCVALQTYGMTVDDNGCCWNIYTTDEDRTDDGRGSNLSIPSAVSSFVGTLKVSNFEAIDPVWTGTY